MSQSHFNEMPYNTAPSGHVQTPDQARAQAALNTRRRAARHGSPSRLRRVMQRLLGRADPSDS